MFTNNYIEMVSKAEEIQKLCQHKEGDYFYGLYSSEWKIKKMTYWILPDKRTVGNETFYNLAIWSKQFPWLPTLEDLFEMLKGDVIDTLDSFYDWIVVDCTNVILLNNFVDIKEFLLCYVMFENYSKLWGFDKKQWEAIE